MQSVERWTDSEGFDFFPSSLDFTVTRCHLHYQYCMSLLALQRWAHISPREIDNMNPITSDKASSRKSSHPKKLIIDTLQNIELQPFLTLKLHQFPQTHCSNTSSLSFRFRVKSNYRSRSPDLITDELYGIKPFWCYWESTICDLAFLLHHILKALHTVCFNVWANCFLLLFFMTKFEKAAF